MTIKKTTLTALSLAVATPSIMSTIPVNAATDKVELTPIKAEELIYNPQMDEGRAALLDKLTSMSGDEKAVIGGDRIEVAGNFAVKKKGGQGAQGASGATHGIWCPGGQWSNGVTCNITRRIVKKPK